MKAGQPSATALLVALSVLRAGREHGLPSTCTELAAQALSAAGGRWRALGWLAQRHWGRTLLTRLEASLLPGLAAHHCRRKRWIAQRLTAQPTARLVCCGVGYDGLGLALLASGATQQLVELDHPDSLRLRQRLPLWRSLAGDHRGARALCLPEQAEQLLACCAEAPAALVIEGVLMYLPARRLLRLLHRLCALPQPPRLLFSALAPTTDDGEGFARESDTTTRWLRRRREPFLWRCAPARIERLLARYGYRVCARWDGAGFGEYLIDAAPTHRESPR